MVTKTKAKPASEFKRENRDGQYCYVKRLSIGGEVHRDGDMFEAYDKSGNFLGGLVPTQEQAEFAAQQGYVVNTGIDGVAEIDLWPLWNAAVDSGCRIMQDEEGRQVVRLSNSTFMTVESDDDGWTVELIGDDELERMYWVEAPGYFALKIIPNCEAFRVE